MYTYKKVSGLRREKNLLCVYLCNVQIASKSADWTETCESETCESCPQIEPSAVGCPTYTGAAHLGSDTAVCQLWYSSLPTQRLDSQSAYDWRVTSSGHMEGGGGGVGGGGGGSGVSSPMHVPNLCHSHKGNKTHIHTDDKLHTAHPSPPLSLALSPTHLTSCAHLNAWYSLFSGIRLGLHVMNIRVVVAVLFRDLRTFCTRN